MGLYQHKMLRSGFLKDVHTLSKEKRTIHLPSLPPLKLNRFYQNNLNRPILSSLWIQQSTKKDKVIVLDEIKLGKKRTELRLRYHIIGDKPRMKGKWTFGQFATLIPQNDFRKLISLAKKYDMI